MQKKRLRINPNKQQLRVKPQPQTQNVGRTYKLLDWLDIRKRTKIGYYNLFPFILSVTSLIMLYLLNLKFLFCFYWKSIPLISYFLFFSDFFLCYLKFADNPPLSSQLQILGLGLPLFLFPHEYASTLLAIGSSKGESARSVSSLSSSSRRSSKEDILTL